MVDTKIISEKFLTGVQYTRPEEGCDSESVCVFTVKAILEAIIESLELGKIIGVVPKRTLVGAECDLLLIYKPNRLPFAPLEIKKPPNNPIDRKRLFHGDPDNGKNKVAGEMWEELNGIRLFGFTKVYGMISTHNQYRLVCSGELNDEFDAVEARHIETLLNTLEKLKTMAGEPRVQGSNPYREPKSPEKSPDKKPFKTNASLKKEKRILFASQIIPNLDDDTKEKLPVERAGPKILQLLILFILKACATLKELLQGGELSEWREIPKGIRIPCRILNTTRVHQFAFGTIKLGGQVNLEKYNPDLQRIYVIRHIGMGTTANCCLGVSEGAESCCAVKFYHEAGKQDSLVLVEKEFNNWQNIYGNNMARKLKLTTGYCLVMPYLKPIPKSERHKLLRKRAGGKMSEIEETLTEFAKKGYKHNDIKWRHLGYWKRKIYLLDLGDVTTLKEEDIESWVGEALKCLRERAVEPKPQKTPVTRSRKRKGRTKTH